MFALPCLWLDDLTVLFHNTSVQMFLCNSTWVHLLLKAQNFKMLWGKKQNKVKTITIE